MKRGRWKLFVAPIAALALIALAWLLLRRPEPQYEGKPVSYWLAHPKAKPLLSYAFPAGSTFTIEFPNMDSNAVPFLIDALDRRDGRLQQLYERAYQTLPPATWRYLPAPAVHAARIRANASRALSKMKSASPQTIQALIHAMQWDDDRSVRFCAAAALLALGDESSVPEEVWRDALHDDSSGVKIIAQGALDGRARKARSKEVVTFPAGTMDALGREN